MLISTSLLVARSGSVLASISWAAMMLPVFWSNTGIGIDPRLTAAERDVGIAGGLRIQAGALT